MALSNLPPGVTEAMIDKAFGSECECEEPHDECEDESCECPEHDEGCDICRMEHGCRCDDMYEAYKERRWEDD
jgi:hypothetical protein